MHRLQRDWLQTLFLISLVWMLLFCGLDGYDLSAPDEPRFALVAQEMMQNGHWLQPHRNDTPYPDKPPLLFWAIAACSWPSGEVTAFTARLPSALAAVWILFLLWSFAREQVDRFASLTAMLILLSSYRFFFQAHTAQIDMLLCAFTTAAACLGYKIISGQGGSQRVLGLLLGLAILAKGPVGYLVPAGGLAVYAAFCGRDAWSRYPRRALLWGLIPPLIWIAGLVVEVYLSNDWDYLNNLLFKQTLVRFLNPWHHYKPFYYFGKVLLYDFLPWSLLLLAAIPLRAEARRALSSRQKFAWAMVLFTLVLFSLSKGKRSLYIVPLYPFAAYIVSQALRQLLARASVTWRQSWVLLLPGLLFTFGAGVLMLVATGQMEGIKPAWITAPLPFWQVGFFGICLAAAASATVYGSLRGQLRNAFAGTLVAMLVVNLLFYQVVMPWVSPYRSARRFCEEMTRTISSQDDHPAVAMVGYRSAYRFFSPYPLHELSNAENIPPGLPNLDAYWQEYPRGWAIVRQKDLELETHQRTLQQSLVLPVGRGQTFLLVRPLH